MTRSSIAALVICLSIAGCAGSGGSYRSYTWGSNKGETPQQSQLQIREFQTRTYETNDTKMVMKAVLNVLQDDAFIVKEADANLGFMTASKDVDVEDKGQALLMSLFNGSDATWEKNSTIEANANISEHGTQTRVRMIFQIKTMDNKGQMLEAKQIQDEKYYQEFFAKVDKSIFIEKEKL